ncbi:MAG: DUF58 domain-containing protein [Acidobacteriota bacterium]|nr:DUF58 domain-containing protein [Acidobacteriota bacterium]
MGWGRIHALIRRRVRYQITRGGALFVFAIALTGAGAFLSGNNLIFLIFSAMLALFLVSGFLSRLVLAGLELELLLPRHVSARVPSAARVRLRNLKRLTPSFSVELSGVGQSILKAPVYFPLIPGRGMVQADVRAQFPLRGRHGENLFAISTRFPFGFLHKSTIVALRREMIVYPSLEPPLDPRKSREALLESICGELDSQTRGEGRDFYRTRPYETQDSARHVDWKSSAHTGSLQVREFRREEQRTVEIFFDRRITPRQMERFEELVENCAYVVWRLADREARVRVRSQRFSMALPEEGEVWDVLKFLALVEPLIVSDAGRETDESFGEGNPHIVFSAATENT